MQRNKNINENMNNRDFCDIVMPIGILDAYCNTVMPIGFIKTFNFISLHSRTQVKMSSLGGRLP